VNRSLGRNEPVDPSREEAKNMLTDPQRDVLVALNDLCEVGDGNVLLDHESMPLPDRLRDLNRPDAEVYQAIADLHELGIIEGVEVAQRPYPVRIQRVTARGRQYLPRA
jgi:hypothetical protein